MRILHLPTGWTIVIDVLGWLVIHLGVSYLMTRRPAAVFKPESWLFRERRWERRGRLYEVLFAVKLWKAYLPDGAALFQAGFRKKTLERGDTAYLERFIPETCRGELTHWIVWLCGPLFFIWNDAIVGLVMVAYATGANLPCIVTQRYNRIRLGRVVRRSAGSLKPQERL